MARRLTISSQYGMNSRADSSTPNNPPHYIGRFAPSPTGPLHMGSLLCAVISYLDARRYQGRWKLRIEDLDPPREEPGATRLILHCLEAHGLHWDDEVVYQSRRTGLYRDQLEQWLQENLVYPCNCTRQRLAGLGGTYDGHCRHIAPPKDAQTALRVKVSRLPGSCNSISTDKIEFVDRIQGCVSQTLQTTAGDFIIHRKDGLYAYVLAGVLDDIAQGVTDVVRGHDLLETTSRQLFLFELLQQTPPRYGHFPVLLDSQGRKLSKQNHAPAVNIDRPEENLRHVLGYLGFAPEDLRNFTTCAALLDYAALHFRLESLQGQPTGIAPRAFVE